MESRQRPLLRPGALAAALAAVGTVTFALFAASGDAREPARALGIAAPEFTHTAAADWLNSPPLTITELRGRVLLVDFWTFDCWNCYRSIPWLKALEERFRDEPFSVIGVHTPEFEHERVAANVRAKVEEFGIAHPVMLDNDYSYWRAMGNRYWPAFFLVDRNGLVRHVFVGETHVGDSQSRRIQNAIAGLLAEP